MLAKDDDSSMIDPFELSIEGSKVRVITEDCKIGTSRVKGDQHTVWVKPAVESLRMKHLKLSVTYFFYTWALY